MQMKYIIQIFAIVGIAVFTGVMLNIGLTLGAYWKSLPPADFLEWFGKNSHFIARTIPMVTIPALIATVAAIWLNWDSPTVRYLWLTSLLCMMIIAIITFTWHLPVNELFVTKQITEQNVPDKLNEWLLLHSIRILFGFGGSVLGIIAIQKQ